MNLYLRRDGRYEGRILREKTASGKRRYVYFYAPTREEVIRKMKAHLRRRRQNDAPAPSILFSRAAKEWFSSHTRRVKGGTAQRLRVRCASRFFVRLYKIPQVILSYWQGIL